MLTIILHLFKSCSRGTVFHLNAAARPQSEVVVEQDWVKLVVAMHFLLHLPAGRSAHCKLMRGHLSDAAGILGLKAGAGLSLVAVGALQDFGHHQCDHSHRRSPYCQDSVDHVRILQAQDQAGPLLRPAWCTQDCNDIIHHLAASSDGLKGAKVHSDVGRGGGSEQVHHHRRRHGFRPPTLIHEPDMPNLSHNHMISDGLKQGSRISCASWQLRTTQAILGHTAQSLGQLARGHGEQRAPCRSCSNVCARVSQRILIPVRRSVDGLI